MQSIFTSFKKCLLIVTLACLPIGGSAYATVDIAEALDTTSLYWTNSGNPGWVGQTTVSHDGVDAVEAGGVSDSSNASLQTFVAGPGTLSFWWKISSETNADFLKFYLDGTQQYGISGEVNWQLKNISVPSGSHVLRWQYAKNAALSAGEDRAWVDEVQFNGPPLVANCSPDKTVQCGTAWAFDAPSGVVGCGGSNVSVQIMSTVTNNFAGPCSYQSTRTWRILDSCSNQTTCAQTVTIVGTNSASCTYVLSPTSQTFGSSSATGIVAVTASSADCVWNVSNTNTWITVLSGNGGTGNGTVVHAVTVNNNPSARSGYIVIAGQLLLVTQSGISTNISVTLSEALDAPSFLFTTIGTPAWFGETLVSHDGVDAVQTGAVADNAAVTIQTILVGPGTLSFWWKVSSEAGADYLKFFLNGVQQTRISGEVDWQNLTYNLSSGNQTCKWTYAKNASGSAGADRAWVDQLQFTPTTNGTTNVTCTFTLSPQARTHGYAATTNTVAVITLADCSWNVLNTNSWVNIISGANGTGSGTITYAMTANSALSTRIGNVLIGDQLFVITQSGAPGCTFALTPTSRTHGSGSSTATVDIAASAGCTWTVFNTNTWVIVDSSTNVGSGTVTYLVTDNSGGNFRSGNLYIAGQLFVISQTGGVVACTYNLSSTSASFGSSSSTGLVNVTTTSGCSWNVINTNGWITIASGANGTNNGLVRYVLSDNSGTITRTGNLLIAGQLFTVTQAAASGTCTFTISPMSRSHGYGAVANAVTLTTASGCAWNVSNTNVWIAITSATNGTGNATISYNVAANPTSIARSGNVLIGDKLFAVTQSGAPTGCVFTISPSSRAHGPGASTGSVDVTTGGSCAWTVSNSNLWITISSSTNLGSGTVTYSVAANTNGGFRSGTINVAGQPFFIAQTGTIAVCTYALSPANASHGPAPATNLVNVTTSAGCNWTAFSTNAWISILSGGSGTGNGSIVYSVSANYVANYRTGQIRIGGETFSITQMGTNPPGIHLTAPRPGTGATLSVSGRAGATNVVECSEDLVHWTPISTNSTPEAFIDGAGTNAPRRFYRSHELP